MLINIIEKSKYKYENGMNLWVLNILFMNKVVYLKLLINILYLILNYFVDVIF